MRRVIVLEDYDVVSDGDDGSWTLYDANSGRKLRSSLFRISDLADELEKMRVLNGEEDA